MEREDIPGYLEIVDSPARWLDYLFASNVSANHKLCGAVIARTCSYDRQKRLSLSLISNYSISRIVKMNSSEVQVLLDDLQRLGYLYDTKNNAGAKKIFALTFSIKPLGEMKE